ncbi:RHS repeat-associated core domain-containing protein, partial [Cronobacter dublinensis]|uniref:RHS repeat-associated core domain-containing protein n=1 Tax=Cronobacter dublinensis TaxID=413497 RepID=UPI001F31FB9E
DTAGRITQRTVLDARRELVFERRYRWDRTDQIVQQIHTDATPATPGEKYSQYLWGYDAAGQVTKAVEPQKEERFFWDPAGNRTEEHRNPVWHNLLLRLDGLKLDYDGFGRLIQRRDRSGVIQHFTYDDEQRVKEITFTGHAEFRKVEYRYDPLGRRTHKILWRYGEKDPETIRFDWQGLQLAGEQSDREPDHYVQYVYTEGSYEPLARIDSVFDDCEIYWYHTELNGLPERVTDADGQTVWRGQFSTWGKTERELSVPQWQVPQNLRFQGQYLDRESGLHYNLFRYYDPVAGRYTQMDPIGLAGGMNTYSYVGDPLVWVDPLGLMPCGTTKFYRSMSHEDYEYLRATGKLRGTSETFISPRRAFSENYEGVLVRFHLKTDALEQLKGIGVKDSSILTKLTYPDMPDVSKGWKDLNAFFKAEGDQINIGLGKGKALDIFNEGIYKFERLN